MPLPAQTFSNFAELLIYINNEVIANGNEEITGPIMNNVVNGLLTFIEQSPLNYEKANIVSTGGVVVLDKPVTVIRAVTPDTISWEDNIYNQHIIINTTLNEIPLADGVVYYNASLIVQNTIPAQSTINIVKAGNDYWIQVNQNGGSSSVKPPIAGVVGGANMPVDGATSWTNDRLKGLGILNGGNIQITVANQLLTNYGTNSSFTLDNVGGSISLNGNIFFAGDAIYVDTNQ